MLDSRKIGHFISSWRKIIGLTQQQVADRLNVSFQAVSKWENGSSFPNTELLVELSDILGITVDELLCGEGKSREQLTYSKAGVDITYTDTIKREMAKYLDADDPRVLNRMGAFASIYDIKFDDIKEPVLVLKSEEPGSKQKLAMEYGFTESICHDMINHLVNDIIVMGAKPLAVLDTIVCGKAEKDTITTLVKGISDACRVNECSLVGGETSIQPGVMDKGVYILTSTIVGIAEKSNIIDGAQIQEDDAVIAIASNGLHTNGYTLVRLLMEQLPQMKNEVIDKKTFIECIMKPHTPYYPALKGILSSSLIHGLAHITGGGMEGNLSRVIPDKLCAEINLSTIVPLPIFHLIKRNGDISENEMLSTFNCGVGLIAVVSETKKNYVMTHLSKYHHCYEIGKIKCGSKRVTFANRIDWK